MRRLAAASATPGLARLWRVAGLLFSLTLLVLLLDALDLESFRQMATGISPASLLTALLIYLLLNLFRTLRFHLLLPGNTPPLSALWPVVLVHNLLVRVLPFKTGEISWLLLLRRHFGQNAGVGLGVCWARGSSSCSSYSWWAARRFLPGAPEQRGVRCPADFAGPRVPAQPRATLQRRATAASGI